MLPQVALRGNWPDWRRNANPRSVEGNQFSTNSAAGRRAATIVARTIERTCILVRMSAPSRQTNAAEVTREAILAAARRQFNANAATLSMQTVAAEAGVSRQTVHHYFGGRSGLRAALAAEGLDTSSAQDEPTRDRLIDAAQRLFSRPGSGLISIEAIAAEAGLTKGAVYHHFADRAELLRAVARRVSPVEEMRTQIEPAIGLPAREGLIAIARAYYSAMRSRADLVRNLAANSSQDPELARVVMAEIIGQGAPLIVGWIGLQVEKGNLRRVDPALLIQGLFGPVFLLIVLGPAVFDELAQFGIHPAIDNVEAYVDLLLHGAAQPDGNSGGL